MSATYETIRVEVAGGIARIELNRPEARNAMSPTMIRELLTALGAAKEDPESRVVVLTGAERFVTGAGGDLGGIGEGQAEGKAPAEAGGPNVLFETFSELGKPIIGRLNGHALAGGLGLACACDILIAADDIKLGTPEVNVGLWPMVIMATISRNIAPKHAMKLYMTGDPIDAHEAARIGLITEAVPRDQLDTRVDELASGLAAKSPIVMQLGRNAYYTHRDMPFSNQLSYLTEQLAAVAATEDSREGIQAFVEKRAPVFTGR